MSVCRYVNVYVGVYICTGCKKGGLQILLFATLNNIFIPVRSLMPFWNLILTRIIKSSEYLFQPEITENITWTKYNQNGNFPAKDTLRLFLSFLIIIMLF
jgi:hypothetical protein